MGEGARIERREAILCITITREVRRNAIDAATAASIDAAIDEAERDPALPAWAMSRVEQMTEDRITAIRDSGVDVIGDPEALRLPDDEHDADLPAVPDRVDVAVAAVAVAGAAEGMKRVEAAVAKRARKGPGATQRQQVVAETRSRDLGRVIVDRAASAARDRARRLLRRGGSSAG